MDAESHLMGIIRGEKTHPQVLDLLARIRAQQGRLREAEDYWRQALKHDPMNEVCIAGLRHIAGMQQPGWNVPWKFFLGRAFLAAAFLLGTLSVWFSLNRLQTRIDSGTMAVINAQKQTLAQLSDLNQKQMGLAEKVEAILAQPAITAPVSQEEPNQTKLLPIVKIDLPGVVSRSENGRTIISFDEGLFKKGSKLKTGACTILTALGKQLEPYKNQITLQVTGYTDDLPMPPEEKYLDNTSLGLSRALMVVEHLRATTGLSNVPFTISGTDRAPCPNDSYSDRLRNRTVSICIAPLQ
ncbi:MAG: hypothetical protein KAR13_19845 [Desulfobulbaceae bacterium]|nr:hypothetical protein [Desulfobulbaceae bacterium]